MMSNRLFVLSLIVLSCSLLAYGGNRTVLIGPGFWNIRSTFDVDGFNIGTQMSLIQLMSGKFLVLDTVEVDAELQGEINSLTKNGTLMEAVLATHPFHTTYFPAFYQLYPQVPFYGTPRHLRIEPSIPWAGSMWDCDTRQKWLPEVHFRIPRGSEFVAPQPESTNHFSGIHAFHPLSKTIHVDDTIMYNFPLEGEMVFHPTLLTVCLYHIPQSPPAFHDWVQTYIKEWDFDNICAAHNGVKLGGAKLELQVLLDAAAIVFDGLVLEYSIAPNATDAALFNLMQAHEAKCEE